MSGTRAENGRIAVRQGMETALALEDAAGALVREFFALQQLRRLRGEADPRVRERVRELWRMLRAFGREDSPVRIARVGPHLGINGIQVPPDAAYRLSAFSLRRDLERWRIGGFEIDSRITPEELEGFLEIYPQIGEQLQATFPVEDLPEDDGSSVLPPVPWLPPAIRLLPRPSVANNPGEAGEDLRDRARRAFFHALAVSRTVIRQLAMHRVPELRKSRAAVHEMIDSLTEENFSLLGLTAIQDFDPYTFQHSVHVSVLSLALGQELGLPRRDLADLGLAALFHDIGKLTVPKDVLLKPGDFDPQDWALMEMHPIAGARELLRFGGFGEGAVKVMLVCAEHHMRYDGTGYPRLGARWEQGLFARIVGLADCYDAMTASRAYARRAFTPDAVIRYMLQGAGSLFDPDLLRLFVGKVGLFPVGSLLRLESGDVGLVVDPPASEREAVSPRVRILREAAGSWIAGEERGLDPGSGRSPEHRISAGCHPQDLGIDVDRLLAQRYLQEPSTGPAAAAPPRRILPDPPLPDPPPREP
jgi:HD-GYP domain-containing protein (c-di-GMP phosphodiesterase class II)